MTDQPSRFLRIPSFMGCPMCDNRNRLVGKHIDDVDRSAILWGRINSVPFGKASTQTIETFKETSTLPVPKCGLMALGSTFVDTPWIETACLNDCIPSIDRLPNRQGSEKGDECANSGEVINQCHVGAVSRLHMTDNGIIRK